ARDPNAYFPSTYSYILAQRAGGNPAQGATLGRFLCYAISEGQQDAVPLRYARLSAPIVAISIAAISKIPGAPGPRNCVVAGSPPPPPEPTTLPPSVLTTPNGQNGPAGNNSLSGPSAHNGRNGNRSTAGAKNGSKVNGRNSVGANGAYGSSGTTSP